MRLWVSKSDIVIADKECLDNCCRSKHCAVSQRLIRQFPNVEIIVGCTECRIGDRWYNLGENGKHFVQSFDMQGKLAKPCYVTVLGLRENFEPRNRF